jgi:hypothetical protein
MTVDLHQDRANSCEFELFSGSDPRDLIRLS